MCKLVEIIKQYIFFETLDLWGIPILMVFVTSLFVAESYRQLRKRKVSRWRRIKLNVSVAATALFVMRVALIPALVLAAKWAETKDWGLFNILDTPGWITNPAVFLLLDYGNYLWHILNHQVPLLWRFHNVHHIDLDLDITTAARFHFVEILFSVIFRGGMILILGAPYLLVLVYEICFEAATAFHHSNWKLPYRFESVLSRIIVTPRMHGIHHSIVQRETNSNYATIFNFWDRLHRTLRLNIPQDEINIGVPSYRDLKEQTLRNLLVMPFRKQRPWRLPDGRIPERNDDDQHHSLKP